jgi:hypothetical protein
MENKNHTIEPESKKSTKDFIKLFIGVVAVIISLVILKYLASALGVM